MVFVPLCPYLRACVRVHYYIAMQSHFNNFQCWTNCGHHNRFAIITDEYKLFPLCYHFPIHELILTNGFCYCCIHNIWPIIWPSLRDASKRLTLCLFHQASKQQIHPIRCFYIPHITQTPIAQSICTNLPIEFHHFK